MNNADEVGKGGALEKQYSERSGLTTLRRLIKKKNGGVNNFHLYFHAKPLKAPLTSVLIACPNYIRKTALSSSPFLALKDIALQEFRKRRRCWRKRSTNQFSKQETIKGLRRPEKEKESHWGKKIHQAATGHSFLLCFLFSTHV